MKIIKKILKILHLDSEAREIWHNLKYIRDKRDFAHSPPQVAEELKDLIRGKTVCDLGCRKGYLMQDFQKYARRVIGIERRPLFCYLARRKGLEVIRGDFLEIELPKADVYYMWLPLETLEKTLNILRKRGQKGKMVWGRWVGDEFKLKIIDL